MVQMEGRKYIRIFESIGLGDLSEEEREIKEEIKEGSSSLNVVKTMYLCEGIHLYA